jgi:proline iminopeptidase
MLWRCEKFAVARGSIELSGSPAHLWETMRANVNGTDLYFDVEGSELAVDGGDFRVRPTLLVLHGGPGFDQGYLRPGLAPLAADAQIVFVDLRGQGRSAPVPAEECTLEQMADDVATLCGSLGIERPFVFGHSAGGFVALLLALRHRDLPGGLVLCDTAPTLAPLSDPDPPSGLAERAGAEAVAVAARLFEGDVSPATVQAFERLVVPHYAAPGREDVPGELMALSPLNAQIAAHFFTRLAPAYDLRRHLVDIDIPTLVLVGAHDWVCPPAAARAIASSIPDSELVVLPDAGHFGFSESPEPFLAAVRVHLARLPEHHMS